MNIDDAKLIEKTIKNADKMKGIVRLKIQKYQAVDTTISAIVQMVHFKFLLYQKRCLKFPKA